MRSRDNNDRTDQRPWLLVGPVVGMALGIGRTRLRLRSWSWIRFDFNVAKEVLSAAAAVGAARLVGLDALQQHGIGRTALVAFGSLGPAIVAYALVDEVVSQALFA